MEPHKKNRRKTSILKLQSVKIRGCLARNVGFDAPTCLISMLWFSCGVAVSMGEAAKPILLEGSQQVKMSFCVAGVALCDIPTCFHKVSKIGLCDRGNTFASFSEDDLHFSWQAQLLGDLHRHFAWQAAALLDVSCCAFLPVTTCKSRGRRGTS